MNYSSLRTDFFSSFRSSIVGANIQSNGNSVPVKATYNDEEDTPPAIVIEPIATNESQNTFSGSDDDKTIDATITGQIFASTTRELDEIADDFKSAVPKTVESFLKDEMDITYDFRNVNEQKVQSLTYSISYNYR